MLDLETIDGIVREVAAEKLPALDVKRVFSTETVDSLGSDALHVTIVIDPGKADLLSGDAALDTLSKIRRRLSEAGEDRFPIIEYATPKELEELGDPEF